MVAESNTNSDTAGTDWYSEDMKTEWYSNLSNSRGMINKLEIPQTIKTLHLSGPAADLCDWTACPWNKKSPPSMYMWRAIKHGSRRNSREC